MVGEDEGHCIWPVALATIIDVFPGDHVLCRQIHIDPYADGQLDYEDVKAW